MRRGCTQLVLHVTLRIISRDPRNWPIRIQQREKLKRPVLVRTPPDGGTTATAEHICCHYRSLYSACLIAYALNTFYCSRALCTWVNLDTIGCLWTGEFDLNTLRVDGKTFESGKKKLRVQGYADTNGRNSTSNIPACIAIPESSKVRLSRHVTTHQFSSRDVDVENQTCLPMGSVRERY